MPSKKQSNDKSEKLAKRTVQIIGFGFAVILTAVKLIYPSSDIPWYVIFGFFGFGASADGEIFGFILGGRFGKK